MMKKARPAIRNVNVGPGPLVKLTNTSRGRNGGQLQKLARSSSDVWIE